MEENTGDNTMGPIKDQYHNQEAQAQKLEEKLSLFRFIVKRNYSFSLGSFFLREKPFS